MSISWEPYGQWVRFARGTDLVEFDPSFVHTPAELPWRGRFICPTEMVGRTKLMLQFEFIRADVLPVVIHSTSGACRVTAYADSPEKLKAAETAAAEKYGVKLAQAERDPAWRGFSAMIPSTDAERVFAMADRQFTHLALIGEQGRMYHTVVVPTDQTWDLQNILEEMGEPAVRISRIDGDAYVHIEHPRDEPFGVGAMAAVLHEAAQMVGGAWMGLHPGSGQVERFAESEHHSEGELEVDVETREVLFTTFLREPDTTVLTPLFEPPGSLTCCVHMELTPAPTDADERQLAERLHFVAMAGFGAFVEWEHRRSAGSYRCIVFSTP